MNFKFAFIIAFFVVSCGQSNDKPTAKTAKDLVEEVKLYEDSIQKVASPKNSFKDGEEYAETCLAVYQQFPESKEAPIYLDKAHVILSSVGLHARAVLYADTLIQKYPKYRNRALVLESLATAYDLFLVPRKKDKVKYYYELLLQENPNMPSEQRKSIEFRLKNIDLTFDQLISIQDISTN